MGFVAWKICLLWVLSNSFASPVAMAAQSRLHAAELPRLSTALSGTGNGQAQLRPKQGVKGNPKTCSEPQSRARSKPGDVAQGSDPACKEGRAPSPAQEHFGHRFPQDPAASSANPLPAPQPNTALLNSINGSSYRKSAPSPSHPGLTHAEEVTPASPSPRSPLRGGVKGPILLLPMQRGTAARDVGAQTLQL